MPCHTITSEEKLALYRVQNAFSQDKEIIFTSRYWDRIYAKFKDNNLQKILAIMLQIHKDSELEYFLGEVTLENCEKIINVSDQKFVESPDFCKKMMTLNKLIVSFVADCVKNKEIKY